jgi:tetratricopeptide (TPR) repeat protein
MTVENKYLTTLGLALGLAVAGCAGPKAEGGGGGTPKTAHEETAPPPPSGEEVAKHQQKEKEAAPPPPVTVQQMAAQKKAAENERADFDAAFAKWEASKKAGTVGTDCKSLASAFESVAHSHKSLAAQALFNAGTLLDQCGDEKGAEDKYKAALEANPGNGFALNNLGEIYYRRGNPTTAKSWFERAIQADPTHVASAYNNLAVLLYTQAKETGDKKFYDEAISKLRRALAIDSDSMVAYNLLALIYYTTAETNSRLALAELVCKQGRETNANYAPIYNTQGLIKLRKKDVTGALKDFEQAVQLDAKYVEAHLNIGAIGLSSRQYDKAALSFQAVLKLQPNNVDATIGLGVALRGQRKFDEAEQMYKKALELDPKNCAVPYDMGVLYQDYKTNADNSNLRDAQKYFGQYVSCQGKTDTKKVEDAKRRSKDIDDTFVAIAEAKKAEEEMNKMKEEMEKQQKQMEEQQRQQQQQQGQQPAAQTPEKKDGAGAPAADATPKK